MSGIRIVISQEEAARFRRLEQTRQGLDSTLRVQMERSMELYADLAEDMLKLWCDLEGIYGLPVGATLELTTDDRGVTFFIQERQRRRDTGNPENKP